MNRLIIFRLATASGMATCLLCRPQFTLAEVQYDPEILKPHLIDIDKGRRLNLMCVGKGSPTVVLEQGGEANVLNWRKVHPVIAAMTRVCTYDRAGFGYSDPAGLPVTGNSVTDDLHALLLKAEVSGPIVLAGHSVGGFYATLYADRFPSQVAGLVLVDPGFAGQFDPKPAEERKLEEENIRRGDSNLLRCESLAKAGQFSQGISDA